MAFSNRASIGGVTRGFEKEERDGAGNESVVEVKGDREWEGGFYDKGQQCLLPHLFVHFQS